MLTHAQIWRGIDRLAAHAQTSPSGLARRAGLDSTTFNPSKRFSSDGKKPRWPSTESLSKALSAAHLNFEEFATLISGNKTHLTMPALDLAEGKGASAFDACGLPAGDGWSKVSFPDFALDNAYTLRVQGHDMAPVYREGDRLIVSPEERPRQGDRVVVKTRDDHIQAWELGSSDVQTIKLHSLNPDRPDQTRKLSDLVWIARVVWVSQ